MWLTYPHPELLIHIVDQDPLPIYLASRQFRPREEILIHSPQNRPRAERLQSLLQEREEATDRIHPVTLMEAPGTHPAEWTHALRNLTASLPAGSVWYHLTGTWKPSSAVTTFHALQGQVPILYLDTAGEQFFLLQQEGQWEEIPVTTTVTLETHLRLFGHTVIRGHRRVSTQLAAFAARIPTLPRRYLNALTDPQGVRSSSFQGNQALRTLLQEMERVLPGSRFDDFFRGLWLEIFLHSQVHNLLEEARYRVVLRHEPSTLQREVDVLGLFRNRMVLISAKTGRHVPQSHHLLELDSLRRLLGGPEARAALVLATEPPPSETFLQMARTLGIRVFDFPELTDIHHRFSEWLWSAGPTRAGLNLVRI